MLTLFVQFKVDSLTQQLQLSQAESTRLSEELSNKSEELTKYRRSRQTEISTLQANYDSLTETHNTTQASLKALQSAHNAQTQQLTQALSKVQTLTGYMQITRVHKEIAESSHNVMYIQFVFVMITMWNAVKS